MLGISHLRRALTLVELLIVIVVIAILVSAVLVASSGFINKSRANNTQAVLQLVSDAIQQFKTDQTAKPTISSASQDKKPGLGDPTKTKVFYSDRYGAYPPDELEVFTATVGLPGSRTPRTLAPGGAVIHPVDAWDAMRFYKDQDEARNRAEHRDTLALVVALETISESASSILDRIPDRNRTQGLLDQNGVPAVFLDRPGGTAGQFDSGDLQIRHIVDDWGNPINYLAQRDWKDEPGYEPIQSSNHGSWNEASTEFIRLNGGQPILFSWGPNGQDQLTAEAMGAEADASLVGDFEKDDDHVVNNPLNDDNVYANPGLREKLAKGIQE